MRLRLRRTQRLPPPLDEATAYARCHGDRGVDLLRVEPAPPPEPKPRRPAVTGESLRRAFEERLGHRADRAT